MKNFIKKNSMFALLITISCFVMLSCINGDDDLKEAVNQGETSLEGTLCATAQFPDYQDSRYVLPYPVGKTYGVDLNACSSSYHAPGQPDQFAIDFAMSVGDIITASESGSVVYVEESGVDYNFPNNVVVVSSGGGYLQYMHLTFNGSDVEVGDFVRKGDTIGRSGATGLAGYPHLHLVRTTGEDFTYPYSSAPVNFSNTSPNERGPDSGSVYTAEPYE